MDRFTEETPSRLAHLMQIWGDEPYQEPLHCGSCNAVVQELVPCSWDSKLMVGPCCEIDADTGCTAEEMDYPRKDAESETRVVRREVA